MIQKVVVFGGNGFLGKRICQQAVLNGLQVVGLSRSGKAPQALGNDKYWIKEVSWKSANVFQPDTYKEHLQDATDVVDTIGILLENENYKKGIRDGFSLSSLLPLPTLSRNPLLSSTPDKPVHNPDFNYKRMNTESAMVLADTFRSILQNREFDPSVKPSFSYVSADRGFAMVPSGYINSKRRAEDYLLNQSYSDESPFRSIIIRPGFMFDELKTTQFNDLRTVMHDAIEVLNCANKLVLRKQCKQVNNLIRPTISTQQVGRALVEKIKDNGFNGIVGLDELLKG
ncbi:ubiquinone biosynthesis protein [Maudiozyma humilis]|uniref:Ubiquinone biosynthesis protein n=1 Tax=Maudiozyma humilis TaxID=51915 RepID=A0AAV5RUV6_MAUHU|nr:ubiquinone biosynthesis protein [Kazachstania humilis]